MAEVAAIPAYILSNEYLLHWMLEQPLCADLGIGASRDYLQECAYVDFHLRNAARPDHVFLHGWKNFCCSYLMQTRSSTSVPQLGVNDEGSCSVVLACLDCLTDEFLEYSHGSLHVKLSQFGWWQNMLSRMSALPIQAHAMWRFHEVMPAYGAADMNATSVLFYPYDEGVENYISESGLNDSHIHVNLMASAEISWLYALRCLESEIKAQTRYYQGNRLVRELYQEIYTGFTPETLRRHLILARRIRYLLMCYADGRGVYSAAYFRELNQEWSALKDREQEERRRLAEAALQNEFVTFTDEESLLQIDTACEQLGIDSRRAQTERACLENLRHQMPDVHRFLSGIMDMRPIDWQDDEMMDSLGTPVFSSHRTYFHTADVLKERSLLSHVLKRLSYNPDPLVDRLTHLYILLMNEYCKLCVQQESMSGFRQFNKYSQAASSYSGSIGYYEHVFFNMHGGGYHSVTNYAELRIAPKGNPQATLKRILNILHGYLLYLKNKFELPEVSNLQAYRDEQGKIEHVYNADDLLELLDKYLASPRLRCRVVRPVIVLHLIKTERKEKREKGDVLFGYQRRMYKKQLEDLHGVFLTYPKLRQWVRGIDAAADEMDTPPDTFAAAYRYARQHLGIRHVTYHAGEDFYHLISGIRSVCETVKLLEYRRGDRIGHATALGVDPSLWMQTMPDYVTPTRGEWLQDLVFLWSLLHECENMHDLTRKLDRDIRELGYAVFHSPSISPFLLRRVFELRKLDPVELHHFYDNEAAEMTELVMEGRMERSRDYMLGVPPMMARISREATHKKQDRWCFSQEKEMVRSAFKQEAPEILALLLAWFSDEETWARANERTEVPIDYLSVEDLVLIQQMAMKLMVERGIVLETLPTSNLRIGQYKAMGQHHSIRWLGAKAFPGDSPPPIVLGTDDPGIFATDIKAEFYHLYASLCKRGLNSQAALEKLIAMNKCGERYAFRSLSSNHTNPHPPVSTDIVLSPDSPGFRDND